MVTEEPCTQTRSLGRSTRLPSVLVHHNAATHNAAMHNASFSQRYPYPFFTASSLWCPSLFFSIARRIFLHRTHRPSAFASIFPFATMVYCTKQQEICQELQRSDVATGNARWPTQRTTHNAAMRCTKPSVPNVEINVPRHKDNLMYPTHAHIIPTPPPWAHHLTHHLAIVWLSFWPGKGRNDGKTIAKWYAKWTVGERGNWNEGVVGFGSVPWAFFATLTRILQKKTISLEMFNLAWQVQSWPWKFPTKMKVLASGSLEMFIIACKRQSRSEILIFFSIFGPLRTPKLLWN